MTLGVAVQYTVNFHVDTNPADAGFDKNIVFDSIVVENWNDSTYVGASSTTTIKVGNDPTADFDTFAVQTVYPSAYVGSNPSTLTVNALIEAAFAAVQAVVNANAASAVSTIAPWAGGGTNPIIKTFTSLVGGSGYPTGTFLVKLTGGNGYGAIANVTCSGGAATSVALVTPGEGYCVSDVLSANISGGTGFSIKVATVSSPLTNTSY